MLTVLMPTRHRPAKLSTPLWEEQTHGSVYAAARGPLAGCMDPASVTGLQDPGEPLGWPVKAFPAPVSVSKTPTYFYAFHWPAGREVGAAVPSSGEPGERTCSLSAAPSPSRPPVKAVSTRGAAEGTLLADQDEHLGLELPGSGVTLCTEKLPPQQSRAG